MGGEAQVRRMRLLRSGGIWNKKKSLRASGGQVDNNNERVWRSGDVAGGWDRTEKQIVTNKELQQSLSAALKTVISWLWRSDSLVIEYKTSNFHLVERKKYSARVKLQQYTAAHIWGILQICNHGETISLFNLNSGDIEQ